MKTSFKLLGGLVLIIGLGSCEKDPVNSHEPDLLYADSKGIQNFNNGMINQYSNETVLLWNQLLSESMDNRIPQPVEVKNYAMVALAVHDALNNVLPKYETFALDNLETDVSGISHKNLKSIADAAVSQAARDMMVRVFPPSTAAADARLDLVLSGIEDSQLKSRGIEIGRQAAAAILAKRAGDFPLRFETYEGGTEPGEYRVDYMPFMLANPPIWPEKAVYGLNLGDLKPFGIRSSDQFMGEAPYSLHSQEYLADYNEMKEVGCNACPARTPEQTEISVFWRETSSSSMNRLGRTLIESRKLDGWEAARLIALIQMSVIDSYIASFKEKFHYKSWRPITAIRRGDTDGVEATVGDLTWTPSATAPTPPNPSFPPSSAYSAGAIAEILNSYFHSDQARLTITSPYYLPGVERHITTFSQLAWEKSIFSLYAGYDFRQAIEVGEEHGRELGKYIFENNLRELKKNL